MDTENKINSMTDIEKEKAKVKKIRSMKEIEDEQKKVKEIQEEVEKTEKNVSKLELISNQILTGLEKDFVSSERQHRAEMNRVRQEFEKERKETAVRTDSDIAAVRLNMNSKLDKKDREIQKLQDEKRSMRNAILAAIGK